MKVEDLTFTSADHVIREIRNMNVKGGSPFGRAAAWAFKLVSEQEDIQDKDVLFQRYDDVAKQMIDLKPTMATIYNTWYLVQKVLEQKRHEDIETLKHAVIELADRIIDYSFEAVDKLAGYGANLIQDGQTILMHSYSSTLMGIFIQAAQAGRKFTVICTESRPLRESRVAVRLLQKLQVPVIYITDAAVYEFMPRADFIVMGADSLCVNGDVANKMGTAMISKLAKVCKKPVYIASELYKLDLRTAQGYPVMLERRTEKEIILPDDFESLEGIDVINQFFDLTPARDVDSIICEFGCIAPGAMISYWEKLECDLLEC
ncbi:MAG: translation initiation factor eIF-2B [Erysipelotrichaceae bacterium]|uniref:Translation initiation factor eIF-2B n=1 Tax=Copranaerobaculum intestinale TaxID=2692629 RepID=A0A6N8U4W8_9FIRM|nr:translation initiation factor eIF-2B [Copranaerobaculum intestinale]MBS6374531.1 translation initiation factor eIF-2B [Erysipelotrichaceae bacterium]MXQ72354.1 translation initiation factor eIF-2B [Copranaerobaculum intestinale]